MQPSYATREHAKVVHKQHKGDVGLKDGPAPAPCANMTQRAPDNDGNKGVLRVLTGPCFWGDTKRGPWGVGVRRTFVMALPSPFPSHRVACPADRPPPVAVLGDACHRRSRRAMTSAPTSGARPGRGGHCGRYEGPISRGVDRVRLAPTASERSRGHRVRHERFRMGQTRRGEGEGPSTLHSRDARDGQISDRFIVVGGGGGDLRGPRYRKDDCETPSSLLW